LNHLVPDYIKLESTLIEHIAKAKDDNSRRSITNLTQQAQAMHAQVVASGIANANQMASIWQFGVTLVQGDMVREPDTEMAFDFAEFAG
jgi:EAL domain-containing protein (putative c-di-GMP-specific phosphodiesterase class I)